MRRLYLVLVALLLPAYTACPCAEPLTVYTVNYPLQYFARRIAGDHARVIFPAPADVDPNAWTPDRKTVKDFRDADLVLLNGAAYAGWVSKASLPAAHLVDTSRAFTKDLIRLDTAAARDHGPAASHRHAGTASTTWLDFYQATQQAEAIAAALAGKQPEHRPDFERNLETLRQDLLGLDLAIQRILADRPKRLWFASPPVYQYLARRYELHIEDMDWAADVMPTDRQWQLLALTQENFPAYGMLWGKQPIPDIAQKLADMDIDIVVFDPCAKRPAVGDFLAVMQQNIANLRRASAD
ncbi:MAG: metal ABC transporter substrate-binding protein [Thiogranum sp.]